MISSASARVIRKLSRNYYPEAQRNPVKPTRTVALLSDGTLRITVGDAVDHYQLDEIPADYGRGFKLTKLGSDTVYFLNVDGHDRCCDCPGAIGEHHACKHMGAVAKLLELKRI